MSGLEPDFGHRACEPKVGDAGAAVGVDEHVLRLDVPVHEAKPVGGRERIEDRVCEGKGLANGEGAFVRDARAQVLAAHVLHREVGKVAVDALVVDVHDSRVREAS